VTAERLLLLCAGGHAAGEVQGEIEDLVRQGIDWTALLAAARRHGLLSLLYHRLQGLDPGEGLVPPGVLAELETIYYSTLAHNARLEVDLVDVVQNLRRAGVEVVVLKGGALASTAYGNPALRPMGDLDLLVRVEQMEAAFAALHGAGFALTSSVPDYMLLFQGRFGGGTVFERRAGAHTTHLDIQHHLLSVDWCRPLFPVQEEAFWQSARPLALNGAQTWQLSVEDTLVFLCLHLALNHGYAFPLIGYTDLDWIVRRAGPDLSWSRLQRRAARFRVRTVVYYGLLGAARMLAAPVPDQVLADLRPGALRLRLLRRLAPRDLAVLLAEGGSKPSGIRQVLIYVALADRARDVMGMVKAVFFPSREWLAAPYALDSVRDVRLYRLTHPLRVLRSTFRSLWRPLWRSGLQ